MRRGVVTVTGQRTDGSIGEIDVLDLDEDSFRYWLVDILQKANLVTFLPGATLDLAAAEVPVYRQKLPDGHPAEKKRP